MRRRSESLFERVWSTKPIRFAVLADASAIVVSFAASFILKFYQLPETKEFLPYAVVVTVLVFVVWVLALVTSGAYRWRTVSNGVMDTECVLRASLFAFLIVGTISFIGKIEISRQFILVAFPIGVFLLVLGRRWVRSMIFKKHIRAELELPVLIIRKPQTKSKITELFQQSSEFIHSEFHEYEASDELIAIGNFSACIVEQVDEKKAGLLILDQGLNLSNAQVAELSWELDARGVELLVSPEFMGEWVSRLEMARHRTLPLVAISEPRLTQIQSFQKRTLDLLLTVPAFIVLLPFLILISLGIAVTSRGPIFFNQSRLGLNGKYFTFYKFRSMADGSEKLRSDFLGKPDEGMVERYRNDPRITSFGKFLRRFSLDELPQLWNVIRGDMSLVGPRPMLLEEVEQLDSSHFRRELLKPGLTGLWQISGRKEILWNERMLLDLFYVDNWNFLLDFSIIARTFKVVLSGKGSW